MALRGSLYHQTMGNAMSRRPLYDQAVEEGLPLEKQIEALWQDQHNNEEAKKKRHREAVSKYRKQPEAKERHRFFVARWRAENPEKYREQHIKRKYGITLQEYKDMFVQQEEVCATCLSNNPGQNGDWHVDHCHKTGTFRGILCAHCNAALGLIKDNPETLRRMIAYLEK